jgi:regulator of cell morphogenesis and NO signaling
MSQVVASQAGFATRTLADIAATLPGATDIFRRRKLDFCCGGQVPLRQAAAARGVAVDELEAELAAAAAQVLPVDRPAGTAALIDLIETRYHATHRRELPELIRLARHIETVHKHHQAVPRGITTLLERMRGELEVHMKKEELILFPMMRRGGHPMIGQPIAVMLAEHDDHGVRLRELGAMTNDFVVPEDACPSWRALYVGTKKLVDELMEHIHIENNVLFPRFLGTAAGVR